MMSMTWMGFSSEYKKTDKPPEISSTSIFDKFFHVKSGRMNMLAECKRAKS